MITRFPSSPPHLASDHAVRRGWVWRWVGGAGLILVLLTLGRSSSAEFEVQLLSTVNVLNNVQFRGVWAQNRGSVSPYSPYTNYNQYEAYAVGVNPDIQDADCTATNKKDDCNGVFYYYNGTNWARVVQPLTGATTPVYSLNAVMGQTNHGEGTAMPLVVAGSKSRISVLGTYYFTPGVDTFSATTVNCATNIGDATACAAYKDSREFYTVAAAQSYATPYLAGGQNGLIANGGSLGANPLNPWKILAPKDIPIKNTAGTTLRQFGDAANVTNENVTQIKFSNLRTSYVVTSTFTGGKLDRTCANAATQTSRLYVFNAIVDNAGTPQPWTQLVETTGLCFFGIDVSTRPETPANYGPQQNIIWIATNNGVYKYDEKNNTFSGPMAGTANKPLNTIVAIQDRGGSGQNLIDNGGFESLTVPPSAIATPDQFTYVEADTWLSYNSDGAISRNNPTGLCTKTAFCTQGTTNTGVRCETNITVCAAGQRCKPQKKCTVSGVDCTANAAACTAGMGTCSEIADNTAGLGGRYDRAIAPSQGNATLPHGGSYAISAQPGISYTSTEQCLNRESPILSATTGVIARVPLSTIEGQKFRVSGWYKVDFPAPKTDDAAGIMASAGITIGCIGAGDPKYINCSFNNRSLLRTPGHPTSGWEHFSIDLSRENQIFGNDPIYRTPILRSDSGAHITERNLMLEVRCQATYGATVLCDDIVVESLDSPSIDKRDTYTVIAAGRDIAGNNIVINTSALSDSSTFRSEPLPTSVRTGYLATPQIMNSITSMAAVGLQHVFAVGEPTNAGVTTGVSLFGRTPSTLTGTIWAGARTAAGASSVSVGPISVSCVSAEGNSPTLCQRSPESYGLSLEITSPVSSLVPRAGVLTGRAWLGKGSGDDNESLNLGSCLRSPLLAGDPRLDPTNSPYNLGGKCLASFCRNPDGSASNLSCSNDRDCTKDKCNVSNHTCNNHTNGAGYRTCNVDSDCHVGGACDEVVRRCWADAAHTVHSDVSCVSEFDCFGRCQRDEGFLCITDDDCRVGPSTSAGSVASSTGGLLTAPGNRLICGKTVNSVNASPLACTPIGWLTFSKDDFPPTTYAPAPPAAVNTQIGGLYNTKFVTPAVPVNHNSNYNTQNQGAHELSGWGRFMSLTSAANPFNQNGGWVHLRSEEAPFVSTTSKLFACRDCDGGTVDAKVCAFCQDANGASCVPSNTPAVAACHYECVGSTDPGTGQPYHCSGADSECTGKGGTGICGQPGFCTSDPSQRCTENDDCGTGTCATGAVCNVAGSSCVKYGVNLDTENNKMYGMAWSQDFGWLDFSGVSYGGNRVIQTKLGDIYATQQIGRAGIAQPQGGTSCNSTYLITSASTITGFCSTLGTSISGISTVRTVNEIPFLSPDNTFENILGRFDLVGIETPSTVAGNQNKYKSTIVNLNPVDTVDPNVKQIGASWASQMNGGVLGGKVYKVGTVGSGITYTLDDIMTFNNTPNVANSLATNGPGSGILIVNGNLKINQKMQYGTSTVDDLRKLASLMIVVRGDLTINKDVENIVGAYYVLGTINTSSTADDFQHKLVVNGLFMAKQFNFIRQFTGPIEDPSPSELIIYDGRLQSNPLPGTVDFTSALPNSIRLNP